MSKEITYTASLGFTKGSLSNNAASVNLNDNMTGIDYVRQSMSVPTTAGGTALPLGSIGTPGWLWMRNTDLTNSVEIMTATSGTVFAVVPAGQTVLFKLAATITAPAVIALTGACVIDYLLIEL